MQMSQENVDVVRHMLDASTAGGLGQASEVPVEWTTFAVLHMRDGKIARAQGFLSRDEALKATGLSRSFTSVHPGSSA